MRTKTVAISLSCVLMLVVTADSPQGQQVQSAFDAKAVIDPLVNALLGMNQPSDPLHDRCLEIRPEASRIINGAVDEYIRSLIAVNAITAPERLSSFLEPYAPRANFERTGMPRVELQDTTFSRNALLAAYTVKSCYHYGVSTIRGYAVRADGSYGLVAATGDDFVDYTMSTSMLKSALSGEMWLLVRGKRIAYSVELVRLRVYAFDGRAFRTLWATDDVLRGAVTLTDTGFVVDHERRNRDGVSTTHAKDVYAVGVDQIMKLN